MPGNFYQERSYRHHSLAESDLRSRVIDLLPTLSRSHQARIAELFSRALGKPVEMATVMTAIEQAVRTAVPDHAWSSGDQVRVGHYNSAASYYTSFFHEVGHNVLRRLGRPSMDYYTNPAPEENFCWRFSREICRLLGVPHSLTKEVLVRSANLLADRLREQHDAVTDKLFWYSFVLEGLLFGPTEFSVERVIANDVNSRMPLEG